MQINFKDLLKEQWIFIVLPIACLVALIAGSIFYGSQYTNSMSELNNKKGELEGLVQKKESLEADLAKQKQDDSDPNLKKIYSLEGMKFGEGASFAPLFDDMIAIAKGSGIRIRSVEYNYAPEGDPIFDAKASGINICELSTTIVGHYSEIQTFLKSLLAQNYLVNIAQVEIVSWKRDKSILIANLKIRYYTRT